MSRFQSTLTAPVVALVILMMTLVGCGTTTSTTPQPLPPTNAPAQPTNTVEPLPVEPTATVAAEPVATETTAVEPTPGATTESVPEATDTPAAATPAPESTTPPSADDSGYTDDRSNAAVLMESFVNAINRREYLRAYAYWDAERAENLPPFEEFEAGYADTEAVKLLIGEIMGDAGAGNFYYTVPVTLEARTTSAENQIFVGCYLLHLSNPGVQGTPPFQPLGIESAYVEEVPSGTDTGAAMTTICEEAGYPATSPLPPAPTPQPGDINAQVYIDDRTDPVAVLQSLFNAVNGGQYVRAYSYWETGAEGLPSFEEFAEGYTTTQSVELTTGEITSDAGAGQIYYSVPVTLVAQTSDGSTNTYVGCYVLHQSQPAIQATPPFQPLGIRSATVEQVGGAEDTAALMATACQP
jgi:hypothetical protein